MSALVQVTIHASQFPAAVRGDLLESLRTRQVHHKFHYDSVKQTQKWLALHQAYSPSRTEADCAATYERAFDAAAARIQAEQIHLLGLGCGGGQKDARLLALLRARGKTVTYTPSDVSTAMVLTAREAALAVLPPENCFPLVWDLGTTPDWGAVLDETPAPQAARLVTFFGMLPNFEPELVLPRLASLLRPGDFLLLSANLAPGAEPVAGMRRILPQYDNELTREWLLTFLLDLGVERADGELRFGIESATNGLQRVAAWFHFTSARSIQVEAEEFEFRPGDSIRLFFSIRYTPSVLRTLLPGHQLQVVAEWATLSEEEGVFLVARL